MSKIRQATFELVGDGRFQQCGEGRVELPVRVNGAEQVIYFATQDCLLHPSDEALVSATLLPGMMTGYDYPRPLTLDPQFRSALPMIQDFYCSYLPDSRSIDIPCIAPAGDVPAGTETRVGTFFSAGVDSFYTLLKHQHEITHLCLVFGMDIPLTDTVYRTVLESRIRRVAEGLGKQVIAVETNIAPFLDSFVHWQVGYGVLLRTAAMLLHGFTKFYIPASNSAAHLAPDGTHPVLDPLWGTHRLCFVHDGCEMTRFRKVEYVSRYPIAHDTLRVCWMNETSLQNCCACEKCVRTMIHLQALDQLHKFPVFPRPLDLTRYPVMRLLPNDCFDFYHPVYRYLRDTGKHPELLAYLKRLLFPPLWAQYYERYRRWRKRTRRCLRDHVRKLLRIRQPVDCLVSSSEATQD